MAFLQQSARRLKTLRAQRNAPVTINALRPLRVSPLRSLRGIRKSIGRRDANW